MQGTKFRLKSAEQYRSYTCQCEILQVENAGETAKPRESRYLNRAETFCRRSAKKGCNNFPQVLVLGCHVVAEKCRKSHRQKNEYCFLGLLSDANALSGMY
jgi:hypothetical protein